MSSEALSAAEMPKKYLEALGKRMAYVETPGPAGAPTVLFLHGNPTSSYIWRNIMPHLAGRARLLAPDLIGMGASDKLDDPGPDSYGFFTHMRYLDAFIAAAVPEGKIVLVAHDWGSALGFHWAARFPKRILGIAYMEALVTPLRWADWPAASQGVFQALRSEAGEEMVLENNFFVERILPASVLRDLTEEEMNIYRRPYVFPGEDRRPTLSWPRELPIGDEPEDVIGVVNNYARFMSASDMPKLLISADPGAILTGRQLSFCHRWPNQTEVTVRGGHFLQEDSPHEIGEAIAGWMNDLMR